MYICTYTYVWSCVPIQFQKTFIHHLHISLNCKNIANFCTYLHMYICAYIHKLSKVVFHRNAIAQRCESIRKITATCWLRAKIQFENQRTQPQQQKARTHKLNSPHNYTTQQPFTLTSQTQINGRQQCANKRLYDILQPLVCCRAESVKIL